MSALKLYKQLATLSLGEGTAIGILKSPMIYC